MIKSAANETFLIWWAKWQKQNAEALIELQQKHGVRILRTPPEILIEFLKTWDKIAARKRRRARSSRRCTSRSARTRRWWCRRSASTSRPTRSRPTTTSRRAARKRAAKADAKK